MTISYINKAGHHHSVNTGIHKVSQLIALLVGLKYQITGVSNV